jgi:hypothetical protein
LLSGELPAVDQVIAKGLAKSPDDRYQTCTGFAAALRAACGLAGADADPGEITEPQTAGPPTQRAHFPLSGAAGPSTGRSHIPEPQAAAPWAGDPRSRGATFRPAGPRPGPAAGRPATQQPGRATSWPPPPPPVTPGRRPPGNAARPRRKGPLVAAVAACVAVLAIAGVAFAVLRGHSTPQPIPPVNPTGPAHSTGSAASGAATTTAPLGPAATVRAYIAAINHHEYRAAWNLGGKNTGQSYNAFANGFNGTARDNLTIVSVTGDVVAVRLAAAQTDGSVDDYQGTYTVVNGVITQSDIRRG